MSKKVDVRLGRTVKYFDFRTTRFEGAVKITIIHMAPDDIRIEFMPNDISDSLRERVWNVIKKEYPEEVI